MKKQGRNFIILMAVLIVLAAGYFLLVKYNEKQQEQEAGQVDGEVLAEMDREDILRFSYIYEGETYVFEKRDVTVEPSKADDSEEQSGGQAAEPTVESRWVYAADPSLNLMQSRINSMAGKFTRIIAQQTITNVTDLSQYGLEEPCNVVHWETDQGSYTYNVGDYNSVGSVYYICEPDSNTVYAVTTSFRTGMDYSLEELLEEEAGGTE